MAVTAKAYGSVLGQLVAAGIFWTSDTIKVMLVGSGYTPDQDAHAFKSSVTNEVTGTGYTAGGVALTGKTSTYDAATNAQKLDAADVSWPSSTITARRAVIYKDTGTASTSPLIAFVDFGEDFTSTAGNFQITWDAAGILTLTTT